MFVKHSNYFDAMSASPVEGGPKATKGWKSMKLALYSDACLEIVCRFMYTPSWVWNGCALEGAGLDVLVFADAYKMRGLSDMLIQKFTKATHPPLDTNLLSKCSKACVINFLQATYQEYIHEKAIVSEVVEIINQGALNPHVFIGKLKATIQKRYPNYK